MSLLRKHAVPVLFSLSLLAAVSGCNCQDRIRLVNSYEETPEFGQGGEPYNALNADAGMGVCEDADGDGYGVGNGCLGPDCDDNDFGVGMDGQRLCYSGANGTKGVGACQGGVQTCQNGVLSECVGEVVPAAERCDLTDNDCDGEVDEAVTQSCYSGPHGTAGVGACVAGTQTCVDGVFTSCEGETPPSAEVCDAVDNDCDGQVDDAVTRSCYDGPSGTDGVGSCSQGVQTCAAGSFGACENQTVPSAELCDNVDNDCNGQTDEGVLRVCYSGPGGTAGVGACMAGIETCSAGTFGSCVGEVVPSGESCDNTDNDCDGAVDEKVTRQCYSGPGGTKNVGACQAGVQTCSAGAFGSCVGETVPSTEVCDDADNDCDGNTDENLTRSCYSGPAGTDSKGVCRRGTETCSAGAYGACVGEVTPGAETCDNKDNDCDGQLDEALTRTCYGGPDGTAGVGVCTTGTETCAAGAYGACVGQKMPAAETCDSQDNDCDGEVDEALVRSCYSGPAGTKNVGVCVAGSQTCTGGSFGTCVGEVTPTGEVCDDQDNDCDGTRDEALVRTCYGGPAGTAGVGVCRSGSQTCAAGVYGSCVGEVTPGAETCDNQDDDCDGAVDDSVSRVCYSGPSGTAGVGTCQSGVQTCAAGSFGACVGERTPAAESCDSADNDCDGAVDDAVTRACYSGPSSTQGVGICIAGSQLCTGGSFGACTNERTPLPETCDSADNNCNGQTDENQTRVTRNGADQRVDTSRRPVDIIFVVDNSDKMNDDIIGVERNINNNFAAVLDGANVDYRVVMLSKHGSASNDDSICITSPLSGTASCSPPFTACPKNGPRFFHYSDEIGLHDSLGKILATYNTTDGCGLAPGGWSTWLRPNANKVFIEITKDSPLTGNTNQIDKQTADSFEQKLFALSATHFGSAQFRNYRFHSIVGLKENVNKLAPWLPTDPLVSGVCVGVGNESATNGMEYQKLSTRSGGMRYPVCDHNIFDSILRDLAMGIIVDSEMACDFQLSPMPTEPNASIEFVPTNGGARVPMTQVASAAACTGDSFYISGNTVTLCPQACTRWRNDQTAKVEVIFSCQ